MGTLSKQTSIYTIKQGSKLKETSFNFTFEKMRIFHNLAVINTDTDISANSPVVSHMLTAGNS